MTRRPTAVPHLLVCFVAGVTALFASGPQAHKRYESQRSRFSVAYPASWYPYGDNSGSLDILSFPPSRAVHAVVLEKSGAEITVSPVELHGRNVEQWVKESLQGETPVTNRLVKVRPGRPDGCIEVREVVWQSEAGPGAFFVYTGYFCSTKRGLFEVLLSNWKGNPQEKKLRHLALKIVESLRTW